MNKDIINNLTQNIDNIEKLVDNWDLISQFDESIYDNLSKAKAIDYQSLTADEKLSLAELRDKIFMLEEAIVTNKSKLMQELGLVKKHQSAERAYKGNK